MKRVLMVLFLGLAILNYSCDKEGIENKENKETLEELYPKWANLHWVSTDGKNEENSDVEYTYPRLEITIVGDVVSLTQPINNLGGYYSAGFSEITVNGNTIIFSDDSISDQFDDQNVTGIFSENDGQITFTTYGLLDVKDSKNLHTYVLDDTTNLENNNSESVYAEVFDIKDAKNLVVIEESNLKSSSGNGNTNFYKITGNGKFLKVSLLGANQTQVSDSSSTIIVYNIYNFTEKYIIMEGDFTWLHENDTYITYHSLLVDKENGKIYNFDDGIGQKSFRNLNQEFRQDSLGNIYYFGSGGDDKLMRISIDSEGNITRKQAIPEGQSIYYGDYEIDKSGNVMYFQQAETSECRISFTDGGIAIFPIEGEIAHTYSFAGSWINTKGNITFMRWENSPQAKTYEILIQGKDVQTVEIIPPDSSGLANRDSPDIRNILSYECWSIQKNNSTYFISKTPQMNNMQPIIFKISDNGTYENITDIPLDGDIEYGFFTDNYFYCSRNSKVLQVSLDDFNIKSMLPELSYDIYKMSPAQNDSITISALRYEDVKKVLFNVSAQGGIRVINESSNIKATALIMVN